MIRPLRVRHRVMTGTLAVLVPVGFALAIAARPDLPRDPYVDADRPPADMGGGVPAGSTVWEVEALSLRVALAPGSPAVLLLLPYEDPRRADVLVYWSPTGAARSEGIPGGARLLGTLAGARPRRLAFEGVEGRPAGTLLFYSLAEQDLLATTAIPGE